MTDNLAGKSVPWESIQKYITALKTNDTDLGELIGLKNKGRITQSVVESSAPALMLELHLLLRQILKENNIINEGEQEKNKMEILVSTVMKLQHSFISQSSLHQQDTRGIIMSMIPHLQANLGATMSEEVTKILSSMTGLLDENFSQLRSRLDELEKNIIEAINKEKKLEISKLEKQLEAKEQ